MSYKITASSDNCYEGTTCLINKLNIRDEKVLVETETAITFAKASMLEENPIDGSFDFAHFKEIHKFLFCDLYDWAVEIRTVDISKKGTQFTHCEKIESLGTHCLGKLSDGFLDDLDFDTFCARIAELYHDMNMIHPFREGNGRAQRAFFTQLIRHFGYDINFSEEDTDFLMIATVYASQGIMDHLIQFFTDAIFEQEQGLAML